MDEFLTAADLARTLKVHKGTIYTWVMRRQIPFVKLPGDTTRFSRKAIEAWLEKRSANGSSLPRGIYLTK